MIRLYGRPGNDSWGRVTEGLRRALHALGVLADFCPTYRAVSEMDGGLGRGFDATVGVYVGPPAHASVMKGRGDHRHRLVLIAANSTWLPEATMKTLGDFVTGCIGPSAWSCGVISAHVPELPVFLWRHGLSDAFRAGWAYDADLLQRIEREQEYRVLHFASGTKRRKGTEELIEGWYQAKQRGWLPAVARLLVVADQPSGYLEPLVLDESVILRPRLNISEAQACAFYQDHHLVAQPSRGEGFGMVPLEARASGVPVLMTAATGHCEQLPASVVAAGKLSFNEPPGCVVLPVGDMAPIDDGPGAHAPAVDPESVAIGLGRAYEQRHELAEGALDQAMDVRVAWTWRAVTELFLAQHSHLLG